MQRGEENIKLFLRYFVFFCIGLTVLQEVSVGFLPNNVQQVVPKKQQSFNNTQHFDSKPTSYKEHPSKSEPLQQRPKLKSKDTQYSQTQVLLIQYCQSCSYKNVFQQFKEKIGYFRPEILVIGEDYPLPPIRAIMSKVVSLIQTALLILGVGGSFIPAIRNHPLYQRFQQKRMLIFIGGYFGLNMLQSSLGSTGAFEIFFNGTTIFSKLQSNRMPTVQQIIKYL